MQPRSRKVFWLELGLYAASILLTAYVLRGLWPANPDAPDDGDDWDAEGEDDGVIDGGVQDQPCAYGHAIPVGTQTHDIQIWCEHDRDGSYGTKGGNLHVCGEHLRLFAVQAVSLLPEYVRRQIVNNHVPIPHVTIAPPVSYDDPAGVIDRLRRDNETMARRYAEETADLRRKIVKLEMDAAKHAPVEESGASQEDARRDDPTGVVS